jgi:hypothetical protein
MNATDDAIEEASSSCERWEWGCAALVVVSVIVEFVVASVHPSYDSPWNRWGSSIADALIALGIVGEVLFGGADGRYQTELRRRSNKRLGEAQERAASADQRAKEAARATEYERLERVKLEAQIAPRRLTPDHKRAVIAALSSPPSLSGKKVRVQSYSLDAEAALLGDELIDCFRSVGMDVDANLLSRGALGTVAAGMWVSGAMGEHHDLIANRIFAALKSETDLIATIGEVPLSAGQYLVDRGGRVDATVFVGVKPVAR